MVVLSNTILAKAPGQGARVQCMACQEAGISTYIAVSTFYKKHRRECPYIPGYMERHGGTVDRARKRRRTSDIQEEEGVWSLLAMLVCALNAYMKRHCRLATQSMPSALCRLWG